MTASDLQPQHSELILFRAKDAQTRIQLRLQGDTAWVMRAFADACPKAEFVQQTAAQIPWFHLCTLRALPEPLVTSLPTVEELESELGDFDENEDKP